jgi:hypothetical protein
VNHRMLTAAMGLGFVATVVLVAPAYALVNYRCSHDARTATAGTHFDGWTETGSYPSYQPTGISAEMNYLYPYAHLGSSSSAWIMLDSNIDNHYAQIGTLTSNNLNVQVHNFFVEVNDGSGYTRILYATGQEGGFPYTEEILFRRSGSGGTFYFYVDGQEIPGTRHTESNWQPIKTEVMGETHNYADQMGGSSGLTQVFDWITYEFYYVAGARMYNYGTQSTIPWIGTSPPSDAWYGRTAVVSAYARGGSLSYLDIWDHYCPN